MFVLQSGERDLRCGCERERGHVAVRVDLHRASRACALHPQQRNEAISTNSWIELLMLRTAARIRALTIP